MPKERKILEFKRDARTGLFVFPGQQGYDEVIANHSREGFWKTFQYTDSSFGDPHIFDDHGEYLCRGCNKFDDGKCLLVEGEISGDYGSCRHWEIICAGDSETDFGDRKISKELADYGETKARDGFGCKNCEYMAKPGYSDSRGRTGFCGRGAFMVEKIACCALNEPKDGDADDSSKGRKAIAVLRRKARG